MITVDNGGSYPTVIINPDLPYAVVFNSAPMDSSLTGQKVQEFLKEAGLWGQVASIHALYPEAVTGKETTPTADLRKGWSRVKLEISVLLPGVKRVLLLTDSKAARVLVPELEADMVAVHGTLLTRNVDAARSVIIVPTFEFEDWQMNHIRPWMERDVARLKKLTKPLFPLEYGTHVPMWLCSDEVMDRVVLDLETTGLDPYKDHITDVGLQWGDDQRCILTGNNIAQAVSLLTEKLDKGQIKDLYLHNGQFDIGFMGEPFRAAAYGYIRDNLIRGKARGDLRVSLKHLGNLYTARPGNYAWLVEGEQFDFRAPAYICEDLEVTWRLSKLFEKDGQRLIVQHMEKSIVVAAEQSHQASKIDLEQLDTLVEDTKGTLDPLTVELTQKYGCPPSQTEELTKKLRAMGYPLSRKTKTGKDSLTAEVLMELGLDDLLEWRKLSKLDSSFVAKIKALLRTGGYLSHRQTMMGAETGRSTMSDFNWQQLPRKGPGKALLISRFDGGCIAQNDLSQAELRVAAYLSGDVKFAKVLMLKDAHRYNASLAFEVDYDLVTDDQRSDAKTVVFRLVYGGRPITEGHKRVYEYLKREFPVLMNWIYRTQQQAIEDLSITDDWGKTRNLKAVLDWRGKWGVGRAGVNSPVQGIASHCALFITRRTWELLKEYGAYSLVLFGVHDSTLADVHPQEKDLYQWATEKSFSDLGKLIQPMYKLAEVLPLVGELQFGKNWADTKNGDKIICSTHSNPGDCQWPF